MFTRTILLISLWFVVAATAILAVQATTSYNFRISDSKSIYDALERNKLPVGLLPKGVKSYNLQDDGSFEVYLDQECDAKFESVVHYDKTISGKLSLGQIQNLTGMSAQDLFLWFPVKGIRVDIPSSGVIYFDVGVVFKQFSLSLFETAPECVAATHPPEVGLEAKAVTNVLAKKLDGGLRYRRFSDWKVGREAM